MTSVLTHLTIFTDKIVHEAQVSRDLRRYARQTTTRLIIGALLLIFILGDGLIYLFYGRQAALMGWVCLLAGISPLLLVWLALLGIEWLARWANRD